MHFAKHMTKYLFADIKKGKYRVLMNQSAKPINCINIVDVKLSLERSLNEIMSMRYSAQAKHNGNNKRYISKMEDWFGVFRLPSILPVNLGSYKFLAGGVHEQDYLLFSELLELNDDESKNVMTLRVETSEPFIRLYIEDSSIVATLTCHDADGQNVLTKKMAMNMLASDFPGHTDCEI